MINYFCDFGNTALICSKVLNRDLSLTMTHISYEFGECAYMLLSGQVITDRQMERQTNGWMDRQTDVAATLPVRPLKPRGKNMEGISLF